MQSLIIRQEIIGNCYLKYVLVRILLKQLDGDSCLDLISYMYQLSPFQFINLFLNDRIRKISNLESLTKLDVLDLHGNKVN